MYQEVSFSTFERAFIDCDRRSNFSYEGLRALFDYLEGYEEDTGERIELDVIALCCEYSEVDEDEFHANHCEDDIVWNLGNGSYIVREG